jgi:hypothetical protein
MSVKGGRGSQWEIQVCFLIRLMAIHICFWKSLVGPFLKPGATSVWRIVFPLHEIVIHMFKKAHILFCLPCSRYSLVFFLVWHFSVTVYGALDHILIFSDFPLVNVSPLSGPGGQLKRDNPTTRSQNDIINETLKYIHIWCFCVEANLCSFYCLFICVLPSIWLKTYVYCHQSD